ncbi:conserved hypothetical protein [Shewanella baltica OS223]|uniref:hypothetical protein n=1 Tax=Shewanella baltica TaxID=62322 RepID=UPI0001530B99|nr:hypothetical protein [Shewanella baltica]ACK47105.1 conserved hypothetical protein [Shewanella baltica OS223]HCE50047.1 hypothetical protein [Shewanella baltica]
MALAIKPLPADAPDFYSAIVSPTADAITVKDAVNDAVLFVPTQYSAADLLAQGFRCAREYPLFYHCRSGDSDAKRIQKHMSVIPQQFKHSVSVEYERLFAIGGRDGRFQANRFLVQQSKHFRGVVA